MQRTWLANPAPRPQHPASSISPLSLSLSLSLSPPTLSLLLPCRCAGVRPAALLSQGLQVFAKQNTKERQRRSARERAYNRHYRSAVRTRMKKVSPQCPPPPDFCGLLGCLGSPGGPFDQFQGWTLPRSCTLVGGSQTGVYLDGYNGNGLCVHLTAEHHSGTRAACYSRAGWCLACMQGRETHPGGALEYGFLWLNRKMLLRDGGVSALSVQHPGGRVCWY